MARTSWGDGRGTAGKAARLSSASARMMDLITLASGRVAIAPEGKMWPPSAAAYPTCITVAPITAIAISWMRCVRVRRSSCAGPAKRGSGWRGRWGGDCRHMVSLLLVRAEGQQDANEQLELIGQLRGALRRCPRDHVRVGPRDRDQLHLVELGPIASGPGVVADQRRK